MIETQAKVVAISNNQVRVTAQRQTGCQSCQSQSSCGTSSLAKLFRVQEIVLDLPAPEWPLVPGDSVTLGTEESRFLRQIAWTYVPALFGFFLSLFVAKFFAINGLSSGVLALGALGLGFLVTRIHMARYGANYLPTILKQGSC
jgi:sigma-E factor negative regulatory protein RseC